jgi:hypothetical protein
MIAGIAFIHDRVWWFGGFFRKVPTPGFVAVGALLVLAQKLKGTMT